VNDKDLHNEAKVQIVRAPAALGTTAAGYDGKIIDRQHGGACEFIISYGTRTATNATAVVIVKEGAVTGTLTAVDDADLLGTEAGAGLAAGTPVASGVLKNVAKKIGYIGSKRYVTVNVVATVTAGIPVGVVAVVGAVRKGPQSTQ
jgi:hypothetical protein